MPSLLGNSKLNTSLLGSRKLNTSMDALATPVPLRCMANNNRKAAVSIGPARCYVKKTRHNRVQLVPVPERDQFRWRVARDQLSS
jgi:hypothetical protein